MKYYSVEKPINCSSCGSPNVVRILYGMSSYEARLKEMAGEMILADTSVGTMILVGGVKLKFDKTTIYY